MFDLAIHGRVFAGELLDRWVYVKEGKIAKVSASKSGSADAEVQLTRSQFLLPAATDLHVHLRDWDQSQKETVETGTMSAIAGGVTTVAEMPNTNPWIDGPTTVHRRIELLRKKSYADFAVHAGVPELLSEIPLMKEAGAFAIKLFPPDLPRFPEVLKASTAAGLKVAVHAEEASMTATSSSPLAEGVAVERLLSEMRGSSTVRFAHISTAQAATVLSGSRRSLRGLSLEVTPHHLFMSDAVAEKRIGITMKVNPQLRSAANSARMRKMLLKGSFDFYATDHAPHTVEEKFQGAPGFPGLEIAMPLFLTKVADLGLLVRTYCEAPARYLGIRKGRIAPGYHADLVVVANRKWRIDPERFISKGRVTPFAGETMKFAVDHVFKGGRTVFQDGKLRKAPSVLVAPAAA